MVTGKTGQLLPAVPQVSWFALLECRHERKVTGKMDYVTMNFSNPVSCVTNGASKDLDFKIGTTLSKNRKLKRRCQTGRFELEQRQWSWVGGASLLVALLQSLCTAVLTISGIRVAIGLTALAAASGIYAPATGWHQDAIRIPMLILATLGAVINLAVIGWVWYLRSRPAAQWRRKELTPKQKRSERLQIALAVITLLLVGLETWTHSIVHRTGPPPSQKQVTLSFLNSFPEWPGSIIHEVTQVPL